MSPTVRNGRRERATYEVGLVGQPSGPVHRRIATDGERGGFAPRIAHPGLHRSTPRHLTDPPLAGWSPAPPIPQSHAARMQRSRLRGGERARQLRVAGPRVARAEDLTPRQRTRVVDLVNADRDTHDLPPIRLADPPVIPSPTEEISVESERSDLDQDSPPELTTRTIDLLALRDAADEAASAEESYAQAVARRDGAMRALDACWRALGGRPLPTADDARGVLEQRIPVAMELGRAVGRLEGAGVEDDPEVEAAIGSAGEALARIAEARHEQLLNGDPERPEGQFSSTRPPAAGPEPAHGPSPEPVAEVVESGVDHAETIPVADPLPAPAAGGVPGSPEASSPDLSRLTNLQRRVLEATITHRGDRRAVAKELGLAGPGNVEMALEGIGKKGLLPLAVISLLPARFAKYSGLAR